MDHLDEVQHVAKCHTPACNCYGGNCGESRGPDFARQVMTKLKERNLTVDELRVMIEAIDLTWIKRKIMDRRKGKGWTQEKADEMEQRYKRFLFLFATSVDARIVPTLDVDAMWHQHILDTMAYFADTERVFGMYLHHFPYFGMRSEDDARQLDEAFMDTCRRYEEMYGEPYINAA